MSKISARWVLRSDGGFLVHKGSGGHMYIGRVACPTDASQFLSRAHAVSEATEWLRVYTVDWAEPVELLVEEEIE